MFKKIIELLKILISKFLKKKAHAVIKNEIASFKIVLPKPLLKGYSNLKKLLLHEHSQARYSK